MTRITGALHEYLYRFIILISLSVLLRNRNISDRVVEKIFVSEKIVLFCEVKWKNIVEPEFPHNSAHALCMLVN